MTLTGVELLTVHAWQWMGGWCPERLPIYLALHPMDDVETLMHLLLVIRDTQHG